MQKIEVVNGAELLLDAQSKRFHHIIDADICDGCGICVEVCPFDCINILHLMVYYVPEKIDRCIQCGACRVACPKDAIVPIGDLNRDSRIILGIEEGG